MPAHIQSLALLDLQEVAIPATRTTAFTSAAIDTLAYEGVMSFIAHAAKGTGNADNTLTYTVTESETSGGAYTAVTLATTPTVVLGTGGADVAQAIKLDSSGPTKRYIKLVATPAGTTPSYIHSATLVGLKKYR